MAILDALIPTVVGAGLQSSAANKASEAQERSDAAKLAEEQRVREQLRRDTEAQRAVADAAFADYEKGLISYAEAQQRAANAVAAVQEQIGRAQTADTSKMVEMAKFQPYSIRTGTGSTFFDQGTGQAGFALSPETYGYQQDLYRKAGEAAGAIQATPEQAAAQYVAQQQGLLQPGRQAEDIALRNQQLSRGRIGMGISGEAAGAGAGGMVNPEQFSRDRARALADAQIAAQGTQAGQAQQANQLALASGLFGAGLRPEETGLNMLTQGANIGSLAQGAGQAQANLYGSGMANVYNSMLGAAGTAQEAAQYIPQANLTGAQEAYNRQQTYLGSLQGNMLPYQAMTMPKATVPGSAYAMAGLGGGLMTSGMRGINNLINPIEQTVPYTPTYGGAQRQITPQTQSNLNYFTGFGQGFDS